MVKVLVVPDKFKGSLTAEEVCAAVTEGILAIREDIEIINVPFADGGEGTFEMLLKQWEGRIIEAEIHDPLMRKVVAPYGISHDGTKAIIELARASGLQLLHGQERNPLETSTYGTGELILHALRQGIKQIILGIGGSATNDAGVGMATALGYRFFNKQGNVIRALSGKDLQSIEEIDISAPIIDLKAVEFVTLCDVTNPLTGTHGASHVFARQKGASPLQVAQLEEGMKKFEEVLLKKHHFRSDFEGAGAAGGMGAAAKFFLQSKLVSGFSYLSALTDLEEKIKTADLVITGEGKLDSQSLSGKVVGNVARLARAHRKPVLVICGKSELTDDVLINHGIHECIQLADGPGGRFSMTHAPTIIKARLQSAKTIKNI